MDDRDIADPIVLVLVALAWGSGLGGLAEAFGLHSIANPAPAMAWFILYVIACALTLFLAYVIGLGAGPKRPLFGYGFGVVLLGMAIWSGTRSWEITGYLWP